MRRLAFVAMAALVCVTTLAIADTLTLNDGSTLEGTVVPQGNQYWIKLSAGGSKMIPASTVKAWTKSAPPAPAPAKGQASASATATNSISVSNVALTFAATKSRADRVDAPLAAVGLWQSYIDANPDAPDLKDAQTELAKWKQLDKDKAEKINGRWVGGEERTKLIEKVAAMLKEANELGSNNQTVKATQKLEEAVRLYPNSFIANFELGYICIDKATASGSKARLDQAIKSLETATRLRPNSAAAWSNLAIAYNFRSKYEQSVLSAYKAAQLDDSKEVVQNLINSISQAPPGMRENNTKVRPIMEEAKLLASKRGVSGGEKMWIYVRPKEKDAAGDPADEEKDTRPGVIGNGSGFLVSADGYLLTNRHVAQMKNCIFMCRFVDGSERSAKVVAIDDESDIAILKIEPKKNEQFPALKLAAADEPGPGAECSALGYPVAHVMNYTMQVTTGTVSSVNDAEPYHVTLTAKITHGNSGGPLVDKYGNVIGVVSAGLTAYTETYGKALSAQQVRKFLAKVSDKIKDAKITPADASATALSTEDIYKKDSPSVLCVILIRAGGAGGATDEE